MPYFVQFQYVCMRVLRVLAAVLWTMIAGAGVVPRRVGVALVTGATDGIGSMTAQLLANDGWRVLLHGRSQEKLEAAKRTILNQNKDAILETFCYDLSSLKDTKSFALDVLSKHGDSGLDVVVQNAGVFTKSRVVTADQLEQTFAVNVAAPFILACLLVPALRSAPQARMLMVSSISQSDGGGRIDLANLQSDKSRGPFDGYGAYGRSKLCMAMLSQEMAARLEPSQCVVASCDPGTVNTKMLLAGWGRCGIEVEDATDEFNLVKDFQEGVHGKYYVSLRERRCQPDAYDKEKRLQLWAALETITGVQWP